MKRLLILSIFFTFTVSSAFCELSTESKSLLEDMRNNQTAVKTANKTKIKNNVEKDISTTKKAVQKKEATNPNETSNKKEQQKNNIDTLNQTNRRDVISLKNGDRISGILIDMFNETARIKAYGNDSISIPVSKIASINTVNKYQIVLDEGSILEGFFEGVTNSQDVIITTEVGPVNAKASQIISVDNLKAVAEKLAKAKEANRFGLDKVWSGKASFGLVERAGNTNERYINMDFEATRKTEKDKLFINAHLNQSAEEGTDTDNYITGGARLDLLISKSLFYFVMARAEKDDEKDLEMRTDLGIGAGHIFYDNSKKHLDMALGFGYEREDYEGESSNGESELMYSLNYKKQINKGLSFSERFMIYPTIDDLGDYKMESNAKLHYNISSDFGLDFGFLYRYETDPRPGDKKNDSTLTTALTKSF